MSTAEQPDFVTPDDYLAAEELAVTKSEYIDGWVRAMTGATIRHCQIAGNCFAHLHRALRGKPCLPSNSDTKLRIRNEASTRFYYPDVQVVCESNAPTDVFQDQPVLIIEVLSRSTRAYDLDEKLNTYLQIPSLECYVILEQHTAFAIVMRRASDGFLRETHKGTDTTIELPFIDCTLPMDAIYEGIQLATNRVNDPEEAYDLT